MTTTNKTWTFDSSLDGWSGVVTTGNPTWSHDATNQRAKMSGEVGRNKTGDSQLQITGTFASLFGIPTNHKVTGYSLAAFNGGCETWVEVDYGYHGSASSDALNINDGTSRNLIGNQSLYSAAGQTRSPSLDPGISGLNLPATTSITIYSRFVCDNGNNASAQFEGWLDNISISIEHEVAFVINTETVSDAIPEVYDGAPYRRIFASWVEYTIAPTDGFFETAPDYTIYSETLSDAFALSDATAYAAVRQRMSSSQLDLLDNFVKATMLTLSETIDDAIEFIGDSHLVALTTAKLVSEGVDVTDAYLHYETFQISASDVTQVSDGVLRDLYLMRVRESETGVTDDVLAARARSEVISDLLEVIDGILYTLYLGPTIHIETVTDAIVSLLDVTLASKLRFRMVGDSLLVTDSSTKSALLLKLSTDTLDVYSGGGVTRKWDVNVAELDLDLWDSISYELVSPGAIYARTGTSVLDVTDQVTFYRMLARESADTVTLTDAALAAKLRTRLISDAAGLSDALLYATSRSKRLDDSLDLSDAINRYLLLGRRLDDALDLIDAYTKVVIAGGAYYVYTATDTLLVLDQWQRQLFAIRVEDDTITLTDAASAGLRITRTAADAAAIVDAIASSAIRGRTLSEDVSVSDNYLLSAVRARVTDEAIGVTDSTVAVEILLRALSDALAVWDDFVFFTVGAQLFLTVDDALVVADDYARRVYYRRAVDDGAAVQDATLKVLQALRQDTISLDDEAFYGRAYGRIATDTLTVDDAASRFLARLVTLSDEVAVEDGVLTARLSVRQIADVFDVVDAFTFDLWTGSANAIDVRVRIGTQVLYFIDVAVDNVADVGVEKSAIELGAYN